MNDRLSIVKREVKSLPAKNMAGLARELGISRQTLYCVLGLRFRSADLESALTEMFPDLPEWPMRGSWGLDGAVPIREWRR
jgi:hypothetical protein